MKTFKEIATGLLAEICAYSDSEAIQFYSDLVPGVDPTEALQLHALLKNRDIEGYSKAITNYRKKYDVLED